MPIIRLDKLVDRIYYVALITKSKIIQILGKIARIILDYQQHPQNQIILSLSTSFFEVMICIDIEGCELWSSK